MTRRAKFGAIVARFNFDDQFLLFREFVFKIYFAKDKAFEFATAVQNRLK